MASQRANIESVKSAITSATTCSPTTVSTLSELLSNKAAKYDGLDGSALKSAARGRIATQTKVGKTARPPSRPASRGTALKDTEAQELLSAKEKAILATEIVNAGLKAISAPIVIDACAPKAPQSRADLDTPVRKALRRTNSLPPSPLQPRSLNRVASSPNGVARPSTSANKALHASGQKAIGECCRIAFACLRALQSTTPPSIDLPPLQLENGMSSLVGKLIAAGLEELAVKELRILKKRLDHEMSMREKPSTKKTTNKEVSATAAGLDELLDFGAAVLTGPLLSLAVATQLQVLKLMTTSKKPSVIVAVISRLQPNHTSSPTQFLLKLAKQSSTHAAKAARQLETLSQLLLSLGPSVSSSDDLDSLSSRAHISPEAAFQLQTSAFLNRWIWWKLAGHKASVDSQIWEPYSRCLAAFIRRSQVKATSTYHIASASFASLYEAIYSEALEPALSPKAPLNQIYKNLGASAQNCANLKDAVKWVERLHNCASSSEVQTCTTAAKLLALRLQTEAGDVAEPLKKIICGMESQLKADGSELDEMILEISKARRTVISVLSRKTETGEAVHRSLDDDARQMCQSMILLCPRFYSRYLGKIPGDNAAVRDKVRFDQRRKYLAKLVPSTIDSVLYIIKTTRGDARATWDKTDTILNECKQLLDVMDASGPANSNNSDITGVSQYVRISNQYFSKYLEMRREPPGPQDMKYLKPLCRSVEVVQYRSRSEKNAAAFTTKLERLADFLRGSGRLQEAKMYLLMLRDELVDQGILGTVSAATSTMPVTSAWSMTDDTVLLARTVSSLVKVERKRCPQSLREVSLIEESWSAAEKGSVLENIFGAVSSLLVEPTSIQKDICKELLLLYDARSYPVRRLRVIGDYIYAYPASSTDVMEEARNTMALAAVEGLIENSEDAGLQSFATHLQSVLASRLELLEVHPRIDLIRPHLASWCTMIEKHKGREALERQIDDVAAFLDHLQSVADFLDMKGLATMRVAVLRMMANLDEVLRADSSDDLTLDYSFLASQYLDLGYSGKAGLSLDRALHCSQEVSAGSSLRRLVTQADYFLRIGNLDKCEETLLRAYALASHNHEAMAGKQYDTDRDSFDRILSDASVTLSNLALQRGRPQEALVHSKRGLRIIARAWKRAERQHISRSQSQSPHESAMDQTTEGISELNMTTTTTVSVPALPNDFISAPSWGLVKPMFRCFLHLSLVYAHHGMFQDTLYYAEQAHKIAVNIDSMNYTAEALVVMGDAWLKAGTIDKASDYLTQAKDIGSLYREAQATVVLKANLSQLYSKQGYQKAELTAFTEAEATLNSLMEPAYIQQMDSVLDAAAVLQAEMARLTMEKRKKDAILPPKRTITRRKAPVKAGDAAKPAADITTSTSDHCLQLVSMKGSILRQKARSFIRWERSDEAEAILNEAGSSWAGTLDAIDDRLTRAEHLFLKCSTLLPKDPIYHVLQDSTISYPAVTSGKAMTAAERASILSTVLSPRKTPGSRRNVSQARAASWSEYLRQAHDHLVEAHSLATKISSTQLMNHVASFLNQTSVLLSTYHDTKIRAVRPGASTAVHELAKAISIERERDAIFADANAQITKEDDLVWPGVHIHDEHKESMSRLSLQQAAFQNDFVNIIPQAWNVVSITLGENRKELILTRMEAQSCPFIVRVPLVREASLDADEEPWGFDQGKAEMLSIIDRANESAHSGRRVTGKSGKVQWWKERDELNSELEMLLANIEKMWLGGFRGVFAQQARHGNLLSRFQRSFQNTLDKHLPSRQRGSKRAKATTKVNLDTRILELFIGLGDPFGEDLDLDEPLRDLLSFVIDILQFHGERNALDELDYDGMVVDSLDALKAYHSAAQGLDLSKDMHTVLILDKSLHCFPWESLPCMKGRAVSRLPSMGCLRDRIIAQQQKMTDHIGPDGVYINRSRGSYILNPGQDLATTQSTFEEELQQLKDWTSIINREPKETEVKDILERDDLYLYFGHGSGAQYIRSKTIKKLPKCATTFLMGCSSATLTDAGEFSVYGPAMSYVIAGAPAVVGTLWDVTDKDIDRFAKKAFDEWGLYDKHEKSARVPTPEVVPPKTPGRGRRKVTVSVPAEENLEVVDLSGKKSLVQAVAEGKKACNYEYLTAAAVVVYGVPVYFE